MENIVDKMPDHLGGDMRKIKEEEKEEKEIKCKLEMYFHKKQIQNLSLSLVQHNSVCHCDKFYNFNNFLQLLMMEILHY